MKKIFSFLCVAVLILATACNGGFVATGANDDAASRAVVSGANGTVVVNGMENGNMTVTYQSGSQMNFARLYVSEGNGAGLVLANADMQYANGSYTYTLNHPTFTSGAKIYFCVLVNNAGVESCVPQGVLSNTTSWGTVTYGDNSGATNTGSSSDIVSGGKYKITAKCSGKAVDVSDVSTNPSANVHQWDYVGGENQQWILDSTGDGYYTITAVHSGLCLDVQDWSTAAGGNVLQWHNYQQANQKWKFEKLDDGYYKITNQHSGKVLDVSGASVDNGANIQQWDWNGSDAQRWKLEKLDGNVVVTPQPSNPQPETGTNPSAGVQLIPLNSGREMTFQFANNTNGVYSNDRIYVCCVARDANNQFCYLTPNGDLIPIVAEQTSEAWTYKLSDINGFQIPYTMTSGRLFISMDKPVYMKGIVDGAGNIGVVQPDLNNPNDANVNTYFDWIEFTVHSGGFWGNTTQVDQFCFPITMSMYNDGDVYYRSVGITESRESIFQAFESLPQAEFRTLVQRPYRIVAPCKGEFRVGRTYGNYMASYVDEVWNYYANNTMYVDHPLGKFEGRSRGNQFVFTCTQSYGIAVVGKEYYIMNKPNNDELFEGSGVLASPSPGADGAATTVELALQAQMCAALNRHIVQTPSAWANADAYYTAGPANFYAKFWHDHSIDRKAYGFCYDDVADHSTLIETHSPRALVIGISW